METFLKFQIVLLNGQIDYAFYFVLQIVPSPSVTISTSEPVSMLQTGDMALYTCTAMVTNTHIDLPVHAVSKWALGKHKDINIHSLFTLMVVLVVSLMLSNREGVSRNAVHIYRPACDSKTELTETGKFNVEPILVGGSG